MMTERCIKDPDTAIQNDLDPDPDPTWTSQKILTLTLTTREKTATCKTHKEYFGLVPAS